MSYRAVIVWVDSVGSTPVLVGFCSERVQLANISFLFSWKTARAPLSLMIRWKSPVCFLKGRGWPQWYWGWLVTSWRTGTRSHSPNQNCGGRFMEQCSPDRCSVCFQARRSESSSRTAAGRNRNQGSLENASGAATKGGNGFLLTKGRSCVHEQQMKSFHHVKVWTALWHSWNSPGGTPPPTTGSPRPVPAQKAWLTDAELCWFYLKAKGWCDALEMFWLHNLWTSCWAGGVLQKLHEHFGDQRSSETGFTGSSNQRPFRWREKTTTICSSCSSSEIPVSSSESFRH